MSRTSLHDFVARALADDRILFADLKRLQRDILPERITSREEAEILLFLDAVVHKADPAWSLYLTSTVRDFAVWGLHPAGTLDRDKAAWISAAFACADPTKTTRAIMRAIVHEARTIEDDALLELGAGGNPKVARRRRPRPCPSPRQLPPPAVWPSPADASYVMPRG